HSAVVTVCNPPLIPGPPLDDVVVIGNTDTLTVTATGSDPLTYQWYEGTSGTTTNPVGTNAPTFTTPAINVAHSYWVRVTSTCNGIKTKDSPTATVTPVTQITRRQIAANTVNSLTSITTNWTRPTQPGSLLVAVMSSSHVAAVGAFGVPAGWQQAAGYEWNHLKTTIYYYPNNPGGRTAETITTASFRESVLQLIEYVGATASPLDVSAFDGDNAPPSGIVSTGTPGWPTSTTSYWVRVFNACGAANSNTATVNVCAAPGITAHPLSQSVTSGFSATLSVTPSGSGPFSYQWYDGASGTTTTPVGTNSATFTTPALTANKSYWVRVTSTCNGTASVNSNTAVLTVSAANQIARRQFAASTANSQTSITTNWTQPTQAGSLLVAVVSAQHNAAVGNFTPPAGWQHATSYEMANVKAAIYYYPNHPGGRTSETFGVAGFRELVLQLIEYTGATAAPLDKVAFNGEMLVSGGGVSTGTTSATSQA